jgi:hypothetical protein
MSAERRDRLRSIAAVTALTGAGSVVWLWRLGANDYDWVIAEEVLFARQPLWRLIFHNRWPDQSPLPFVVMRAARVFGESPFAVSLPNVVLLAACVVAIFLTARAVSARARVGLIASALFIVSPVALWCARFGRVMYPASLLLGLWAAHAAWRYVETRRTRWLGSLVAACTLSIYNHFYGFIVAGLAFAFIGGVFAVEAFVAWDGRGPTTVEGPLRRLVPVMLGLAALQLLVQPQIVRAVDLVRHPYAENFLSIRGGAGWSLWRLAGFWLSGSEYGAWPLLPLWGQSLYAGSAGALFLIALWTAPARARYWFVLFVLGPFAMVLAASSGVDLRERYFVFAAAPLFVALAYGAAMPRRSWGRAASAAIVVIFAIAAGRVLSGKVPERNIEWTKLLTQVQAHLGPTSIVYACPAYIAPAMQAAAERAGLDDRLAVPSAWVPAERDRLAAQLDRVDGVAFIWPAGLRAQPIAACTSEMAALARLLEGQGWAREPIFVLGAGAEIFTRRAPSPERTGPAAQSGKEPD